MKNKINLTIYKIIKWWFIICAIILPMFLLFLKFVYGENISWVAIIVFPLLCFLIVKFMEVVIRKTNKKMTNSDKDKN